MRLIGKIVWYLTYFPFGMALALTMCLGIGLLMLVVDFISLFFNGSTMEWPKGFFVGIYLAAAIRYWIGYLCDWDVTNFKAE